MKVNVDSGKYTFCHADGVVEILRHGKPWHAQHDASNAISSLMAELDAARVVLQAARRFAKVFLEGEDICASPPSRDELDAANGIVAALERHGALVDDREPPSEWCALPK